MGDMQRRKPRYHHGDLRNALVAQAVRLVEKGGPENFSLREAARLEGVSAKAAYRHFADKSDLVAAVAEYGFRLMERKLVDAIGAVSDLQGAADAAIERLRAAGRAYVEFAVEHPELLRVMFGSNGLATLESDSSLRPAPFVLLSKTLDDLMRAGVLPADRRPKAELKAWTVVHGFASLVVQAGGAIQRMETSADALESILDFAMVGLCGRLE
ncbi:MAG: TetR/AcrR family transcriptional regulator [Roseiarcus sp.]